MIFFIPGLEDNPTEAEKVYNKLKEQHSSIYGKVIGKRIYKISYKHDDEYGECIVGKATKNTDGNPVYAILETDNIYLILSSKRGAFMGIPILIGKSEVFGETLFNQTIEPFI